MYYRCCMATSALRAWLLGGVALVVGCGRSNLWPGLEGDKGGMSSDRAGSGGGSAGSGGGSAGVGGGSAGVGGMAPAGAGSGGTFVSGVGSNSGEGALGGRLEQHAELFAQDVRVFALSAAPDGRVAMGGSFAGTLNLGGQVLTSSPEGSAFVAVVDAEARLQWARSVEGERGGNISGLAFTPDGAVVAQGDLFSAPPDVRQFAVRFDERGEQVWRQDFGNGSNSPSKVVVDQAGDAWLGGTPNLLRLNAAGELVGSMKVLAAPCPTSQLKDLVADDKGRLILTGVCSDVSGPHAFLQKRDANGTISFEKRITGTFSFSIGFLMAAVDHAGRITVGATLKHSLEDGEGETVYQAPDSAQDLWFAQYTPGGDRLWQRTYSSDAPGLTMDALATDPFDNILALGDCNELRFGQMEIISRPQRPSSPPNCVLKLRQDGTPVWGHFVEGGMSVKAMTADATAHVWLGGTFTRQAWFGDQMIVGNETRAGLVLRLSP
jgi:hypothetical protein